MTAEIASTALALLPLSVAASAIFSRSERMLFASVGELSSRVGLHTCVGISVCLPAAPQRPPTKVSHTVVLSATLDRLTISLFSSYGCYNGLIGENHVTQNRAKKHKTTEIFGIANDRPDFLLAIGSRIRTARLEMGSSVEAFASSSGLTPSQLSHIERGLLRISAVQLYDSAQHCNKPLGYFFADQEPEISAERIVVE